MMMEIDAERSDSSSNEPHVLAGALSALRKQWPLAVAILGLVVGTVAFLTLGMTPVYQATATILFDPNVPRPLGDQVQTVVATDGSSHLNNKEYYRTQMWMIRSTRVLTEVVQKLNLVKDPYFLKKLNREDETATVEAVAEILDEHLEVEQIRDSRLVVVKYRDVDPERARRVLTALVDTYVQKNLDDIFESATTAADWLRSQLDGLWRDLESSEMALHEYKKRKNILSVSMDDQSNMLRQEMQQLNQVLTQLRARREHISARVETLNRLVTTDTSTFPALELIESPVLQKLREAHVIADQALQSLMEQGKGENHPEVRSARAARDTTLAALVSEVQNIQKAYNSELDALNAEIAGVEALYRQAEQRALDLNLLEIEHNRLLRAKEKNEKLFSLVVERSKETDLTRMLKVNNIRVVDRPQLPKKPIRPNVPLNLAGGLIGGVILGFAAALGRERLDRTVKAPEDIEQQLRQPFLGILPQVEDTKSASKRGRRRSRSDEGRAASSAPELITHLRPTSGIAEAARAIRTNVTFMSPDKPHRTVLVTSSAPAEGKTMVTCLLAVAMAQAGQKVLILDCDLRRPRVHRVFGMGNDVGVTSTLIGPADVLGAIRETPVENLSVLTAGPLPPNPAELLHSEAFSRLLEKLRGSFDRIIIDSPPVVPVTDAAVLSTKCDGAILVVRASKTSRELARRGVEILKNVGGRIVGVVLNAVDLESNQYGYYQRYSYYGKDGYYASSPAPVTSESMTDA